MEESSIWECFLCDRVRGTGSKYLLFSCGIDFFFHRGLLQAIPAIIFCFVLDILSEGHSEHHHHHHC